MCIWNRDWSFITWCQGGKSIQLSESQYGQWVRSNSWWLWCLSLCVWIVVPKGSSSMAWDTVLGHWGICRFILWKRMFAFDWCDGWPLLVFLSASYSILMELRRSTNMMFLSHRFPACSFHRVLGWILTEYLQVQSVHLHWPLTVCAHA